MVNLVKGPSILRDYEAGAGHKPVCPNLRENGL
jgi:hypothetical protein